MIAPSTLTWKRRLSRLREFFVFIRKRTAYCVTVAGCLQRGIELLEQHSKQNYEKLNTTLWFDSKCPGARPRQVESGIHALSRGDPLPRPRTPKASETQRPRGSPKSAVSGAAPTPGAAGSHASLVDGRRRDSGGAERGRKGSVSPMAKRRGSTQVRIPLFAALPRFALLYFALETLKGSDRSM